MLSTQTMAIVGSALLAMFLLGIIYAIVTPPKQHDPQRGQAIGCLMIVAIGIGALLLLMGLGWWLQWTWLITAIFYIAAFPAVMLVITGVRYLIIKDR